MPIFRRELAFSADDSRVTTKDWWHLVLDTDTPGLYVEYRRQQMSAHSDGTALEEAERYGINDFLTLAQGRPAQPALLDALREMFREADRDEAAASVVDTSPI